MAIPEEIRGAIAMAVGDAGQSSALAARLIAWFEAVASGNESLEDFEPVKRRLDVIFPAVEVSGVDSSDEELDDGY